MEVLSAVIQFIPACCNKTYLGTRKPTKGNFTGLDLFLKWKVVWVWGGTEGTESKGVKVTEYAIS